MTGLAYAHAKVGDPAVAVRLAQQALDRCEPEGSLLLVATRVAAVATELDAPELARRVIGVLSPLHEELSGAMPTVIPNPRQLSVLELVAAGATNAEVAQHLNFSVSTTRLILASLYDLFGTRNRRELAAAAMLAGIGLPQSTN